MNRIITVIVIFLLVIGLAVCESVYTISVSEQVKYQLNTALELYKDGDSEKAEESLKKADTLWNNSTVFLNAFLNHDNVEEIAERISATRSTLKYDSEHFPIECERAVLSLKVVIYSMLPYLDNIL